MKGTDTDGKVCEEFTPKYYGLCFLGGMLSSGTTHLSITPLDVLKVNMQVGWLVRINWLFSYPIPISIPILIPIPHCR